MEDLQSTLRSILSDPEQMARVAALAESLGLKPPEPGAEQPAGAPAGRPPEADAKSKQRDVGAAIGRPPEADAKSKQRDVGAAIGRPPEADGAGIQNEERSASDRNEESIFSSLQSMGNGIDLPGLMSRLSSLNGSEDRVLNALRPGLDAAGQGRVDRALRAAKLSRLAAQLLRGREGGHV